MHSQFYKNLVTLRYTKFRALRRNMAERFKQVTSSKDRLQLFCNKTVLCCQCAEK